MEGHINITMLGRLLNNLHTITGIKFALMDHGANEMYTSNYKTDFCACIADTEEGYARCLRCDAEHLRSLRPDGLIKYRCHAGLIEAAIPITENGHRVATVHFGQLLSDDDYEAQWERTRALCMWYRDPEKLKRAFWRLRRMAAPDITACSEIVLACVSEVRLKGLLEVSRLSDYERLTLYIDQHYAEKLTLPVITRALGIGTTKLCGLSAREGGATPMQLLTAKRMAVAQGMLVTTNVSISQVADAVGISDYNYFAKVFKRHVGMAPHTYRKRMSPGDAKGMDLIAPRELPLDPDREIQGQVGRSGAPAMSG